MLNVMTIARDGASSDGVGRAMESVRRQGFLPATESRWQQGSATAWTHPQERDRENCEIKEAGGSALGVGPIWYRGQFGSAALSLLLRDMAVHGCIDPAQARGNYTILAAAGGQCTLMNDALGLVRVYISSDRCFYSTSWLASCAYAGSIELDEAAAIEYVLLGAPHSNATLGKGINTLPLGHSVDMRTGQISRWLATAAWSQDPPAATIDGTTEVVAEYLRTVGREVAMAFPGRVRAALSGGFDSRLIVASLLAVGSHPALFVYGTPDSDDVRIAQQVAEAAGLPLEHIDKQALARGAAPLRHEDLVANASFFDGLSNDGVCDRGVDLQTRLAQTANGGIALNGGGGEIFRNYFHLPDRPLHAIDVVRAFYRGFDPKVFRRVGGVHAYQDRMVAAIEGCLRGSTSGGGRYFKRSEIELLYPLFRCHFWMAMNNSIGVRHGYYSTPLIDYTTVRIASRLPMMWKNSGRLQSRLINQLHPLLARQVSTYGFRFADGPGWSARFADWRSRMRPVHVRPWINAIHRRAGGVGVSDGLMAQVRSLLPGEWQLDPVLDLARLPDQAALSRATAVEVAWRELL
jgi:asparagine synthase (glutamine-hydrolysing)